MTPSAISRILNSAGHRRSKFVSGRIASTRSEGFKVEKAGLDSEGHLIVRVEYEFSTYQYRTTSEADAQKINDKHIAEYKRTLECRGYIVRLVQGHHYNSLAAMA